MNLFQSRKFCFFPSHDGDQQAQEDNGDVII